MSLIWDTEEQDRRRRIADAQPLTWQEQAYRVAGWIGALGFSLMVWRLIGRFLYWLFTANLH